MFSENKIPTYEISYPIPRATLAKKLLIKPYTLNKKLKMAGIDHSQILTPIELYHFLNEYSGGYRVNFPESWGILIKRVYHDQEPLNKSDLAYYLQVDVRIVKRWFENSSIRYDFRGKGKIPAVWLFKLFEYLGIKKLADLGILNHKGNEISKIETFYSRFNLMKFPGTLSNLYFDFDPQSSHILRKEFAAKVAELSREYCQKEVKELS